MLLGIQLLLFSGQVMSRSLRPHGLQHARLLCPPLSLGVSSNSCPLIQWCYLTISSSAAPFSFLPSIFPSIRVFSNEPAHWSWNYSTCDQSIGASASASVLPMNIQGWFPVGLTGWISLLSEGLLRVFSSATIQRNQFFSTQPCLWSSSQIHTWLPEKPWLWLHGLFSAKWCLCFLTHYLGLS